MIKISVIIPTYNRRHVLERTLPSLAAQDLAVDEYEVIVVVDGSTDGTADWLRELRPKFQLRTLEVKHGGPAAARNAGIRAAAGELVLLLDDDLIAVPELLREHCASHEGTGARVVNGPIIMTADSAESVIRYVTEQSHKEYVDHLDPAMDVRYPEGTPATGVLSSMANSSMPREVLLRCGGFDEEIRAAEDLELGLRLWKMGVSFRCRPAAISYEYYVKSSREHLRGRAVDAGAGDLRVSRKHPEYRPHSRLAGFAETRAPKRWLRSLVMRMPVSPVPLLALPLGLERWFCRVPPLRYAGTRLLGVAEGVARLRSGLQASGSWGSLKSEFGLRCPVLMYHHVGPYRAGTYRSLNVSAERFEQQMRWLVRRGYVGVSASDWLRWLREGKGLPKKPILITFDDGYADIVDYALPVLERYGFGGTVFVVTGQLAGTNTWDEQRGSGTLRLMSAEQIRTWAGRGIEFGAHSRTHPELTKLSREECLEEIAGSKKDLEELLGAPVAAFAYPYGDQNETVRELVRGQFDLAFSIEEGVNFLRSDPCFLRRAYIGPDDSLLSFAFNVPRGGLRTIRDLRIRLGVRTRIRRALGMRARGASE